MNAIIITSEQRDELVRCIQSKITAIRAKLRWMDRRDAISPPHHPAIHRIAPRSASSAWIVSSAYSSC